MTAPPEEPAGDPTPSAALASPPTAAELETELRGRLLSPGPTDRLWGWLGPLLVTAVAAVVRLVNLTHPGRLMFDETYYVKQAYSLLTLGYEGVWEGDDVNDEFKVGDFSSLTADPDYVVHPQVGKWLIAVGLRLFGPDNGVGWRFSAAVAGTLTVLILARLTRRLTGSTLLGCAAGLLLALDGLHLTGSRIGLLDVFLGLFVLAALAAVLLDRDQQRSRLARAAAAELAESPTLRDSWGPRTGMRWWLVLAGVLLGLGGGVKWSAIYALAVFGILVLVWDLTARRMLGVRLWFGAGVFRGGLPAFLALVPVAAVTYVAGWFSWFASSGAYLRQWAADQVATHGSVARGWLPDSLNSLWEYHRRAWDFHTGLDSEHTYEAHPAGWLLQLRPTAFYWQNPAPDDCGAAECVQVITSVGNPVVWWLGALGLLVVVWVAIVRRDWRAWVPLAGYAATYLPWFLYTHRTIFTFYTIALAPYVALVLALAIGYVGGLVPALRPTSRRELNSGRGGTELSASGAGGDDGAAPLARDGASSRAGIELSARRGVGAGEADGAADDGPPDPARPPRLGVVLLAVVCLAAVAAFACFWPVWTGQTLPYDEWRSYMWLGSWV